MKYKVSCPLSFQQKEKSATWWRKVFRSKIQMLGKGHSDYHNQAVV